MLSHDWNRLSPLTVKKNTIFIASNVGISMTFETVILLVKEGYRHKAMG